MNSKFLGLDAISLTVASKTLTPSLIVIKPASAKIAKILPWSATELEIMTLAPSFIWSLDFTVF